MSQDTPVRCAYSAAGHIVHPIQMKLAYGAGEPVVVELVGEHEHGILVAPVDSPDHVEVWCMHQKHRDTVHAAQAAGIHTLLSWEHSLARIGDTYVSHTSPEHWRECPQPGELTPLEQAFVSKDALLAHLRALAEGRVTVVTPDPDEE